MEPTPPNHALLAWLNQPDNPVVEKFRNGQLDQRMAAVRGAILRLSPAALVGLLAHLVDVSMNGAKILNHIDDRDPMKQSIVAAVIGADLAMTQLYGVLQAYLDEQQEGGDA